MPNFAIEAPAEVQPLTEFILYNTLLSASSSNPNQIQAGTKQLQQWETQPGFYALLQTVYLDTTLPNEVRYLSIIQLKNGIDKYWRKSATNAVGKEDRALIRSRLLDGSVNEADSRLAIQAALVSAKIVRFEWPNDWPDAINLILNHLRSSTQNGAHPLYLRRILLVLLHVVKELATGRLQRTRASLQSVSPEVFQVIGRIFLEKVQVWQSFLQKGGDDEGAALESIEDSLLAMKVIRRLLVAGFEFPNRDADVAEFWKVTQAQFGDMLTLLKAAKSSMDPSVADLIEKHLVQFAKLHLEMARTHPAAFALLPNSVQLIQAYWMFIVEFGKTFGLKAPVADMKTGDSNVGDEEETTFTDQLALKGLLLIRACLKMVFNPAQTFKYRHEKEKQERAGAVDMLKTQLFTDTLVREMMETVVTRFFVFRAADMRDWQDDPEEWERQQDGEGETYEFTVRPCAEKLFLDLAINYKKLIAEPLLAVFRTVADPANEDVLLKDSVYTAMGLAAPVVNSAVDFDAFISSTLTQEVQIRKPGYNILRRRIAILLGQWITIKVSDQSRPLVFQIFQHLLDKDDTINDLVVRITAGRHFKEIADDWSFDAETFQNHAPIILSQLMALIEEVDLSETKLTLLNTISVVVERLDHLIVPFADRIVSLLPPLWEQSGDEHLMKQAILTILSRLINAMKDDSRKYHSLVLPIVKGAVEPDSGTQSYLIEDALDVWHAVLKQTVDNEATPDLLALSGYLIPIFTTGSEVLRRAIEIMESYLMLSPATVLAPDYRRPFLEVMAGLMGSLKPEPNGYVSNLIENVIRAAHSFGGEEAMNVFVGEMVDSGFFARLVGAEGLRGSWVAHQTTGPKSISVLVDGIVETDYFSVLARVCFVSTKTFVDAVRHVNAGGSGTVEGEMKWLLEEWFSHWENVGDPGRRKLMALALTRLLGSNEPWILVKLQDLMTMWTDVVAELTDGMDDRSVDCLTWTKAPGPFDPKYGPPSPEEKRVMLFSGTDPVRTVNLVAAVRDQLAATVGACGGEARFADEWLVNVDRDVVKAFKETGIF